ncbi:carbohydrate-binding module family 13 protein [Sphaerobolus stellatus SS14]|uniref:Carbohydrate-binding module family 13 protein n=1 Tax=Sphaerobolus stellatus (strain SS14) TaxID=990650 RepID=A0A0C9VMX3_SPHS4|nr:carbohydrate-binding module family 13 protein [Sphaerobolus stellatus SS14]KIJ39046.1 carbohydrate-binding module family 13 protein [Sphaerobolus stellatus SS14]
MYHLFSTLVAAAILGGVHAAVPNIGDFFQLQLRSRGNFPRTPCATVFNAANGSAVVIEDCSAATQQRGFQVLNTVSLQPGQFRIFNSFCLEATEDFNGAKVMINSCVDGNPNQLWLFNTGGQIQWGGDLQRCLDLTDGILDNGNQLQIWDCNQMNNNPNQQWTSAPLADPVSEIVNTGTGESSLCMAADSSDNGAPVFAAPCSDTTSRKVWFNPQPGNGNSGSYRLAFGDDGAGPVKCLDVTDGVDAPGTRLQLWDCTGGPNQQFLPTATIRWDGIPQDFPKCVDLTDGVTTRGNQLQIWNCTAGNGNQLWMPLPPNPQTAT